VRSGARRRAALTKGFGMFSPEELDVTETDEGIAEIGDEAEGEGHTTPKTRKSYAQRATGNLRAAKRGLQGEEWKPQDRAQFLLAEANVLALLDLASAIREARSVGAEVNGASTGT
jgi:hypothetical protein